MLFSSVDVGDDVHRRSDELVFLQRKSRRYYPTRLAITLATGVATTSSSVASSNGVAGDTGFIVVETNYRIYAYTGTL